MNKSHVIRIIALILGIILIISSLFIIRSCSAPPEYEEIKGRLEQLVNDSYPVNEVIWGKGLPTYERVYSPTVSYIEEKHLNEAGEEVVVNYHYYFAHSEQYTIVAFTRGKDDNFKYSYAFLADKPYSAEELALLFPVIEQIEIEYYKEVYADESSGKHAYLVPFTEKKYVFYYSASDPDDYDFVLADSEYASVDAIKAYVRTVYGKTYADSLDAVLFDGVAEGSLVMKARYSYYSNSLGVSMLASLNTYEPLFTENRVYRFETGKILRNSSNNEKVVIEIESYLPSNPEKTEIVKLSMALEDGVWYLAAPSF